MTALSQTGVNTFGTSRSTSSFTTTSNPQRTSPGGINPNGASRSATQYVSSPATGTGTGYQVKQVTSIPTESSAANPIAGPGYGLQSFTLFNSNATTGLGLYAGSARVITGTVVDQNSSPLSRKVVAINPRTYRVIAVGQSSGAGAFTLALPYSNESAVHLFAEPNAGEARNVAFFANVAPVVATGTPGGGLTDPFFSNVVLLLHANGSNGSPTVTDSSSFTRACTAFGTAQLSNAQAQFGATSLYFDGTSGGYVFCADTPDVNFATGDFTVEMWARFAATGFSNNALLTLGTTGAPTFELYRRGGLNLWNGSSTVISGTTTLAINTWYHIAWVRYQGVHALYVNGNLEGTAVSNAAINPAGIILGSYTGTLDMMNGWLDDVRVTNNVGRYTNIFVPPTAAFPNS